MALSVRIQKQIGGLSLSIAFETDGVPLGLLGASGAGKSVTLQCIAGTMRPDAGRIVLNGRVLFDSERRICLPPQKRNIGFLFQQYALFPNMTVRQNILAGVRFGTRKERQALADRMLTTFRLEDAARQYPATLSGGQQQRTALARILIGQPELLLLDEPFSAIDVSLKRTLSQELSDTLAHFGGDVVFVSHERDEVRRFCPLVCVLDHGIGEPVQRTERLLSSPETVAAARLAGFANLTPAEPLSPDAYRLAEWNLTVPARLPCSWVCLPENAIRLSAPDAPGAIRCTVLGTTYEDGRKKVLLFPENAQKGAIWYADFGPDDAESKNRPLWIKIDEKALIYLKNSTEFIH